ncbi:sigma-70 family RNA polymerase sigma factor [Thermophilibacter sp.]|uniref:sigma-70 family RNA polymerase sigma factor n=1 Tax=Thermophilibacter sp. TaxID=2847309 RepID=UPI003A8EFB27
MREKRRAERLVNTYADLILRVAYTYLGSRADAEDVCQETLLRLLRRREPFESAEHERAWVVRMTANLCRDLLRRRASHLTVALSAAGGVTVSADAVLGDDTHYVVVYSLTPDDPTLFENVARSDEGTVLLGFSNIAIPENVGATGGGMGAYFYDADPDDASVQYVQQCWAESEDGLAGTTAYVKLVDLCALDPETLEPVGEPLATGTWVLEVPLDYESAAISLPTGQTVDYEGASVTVTELSVSPLGAMISYDLVGTPDTSQEFPQLNLPVFVNFADGTSFDATWVGGFGDDTHVTKGASFDRIVDAEDIVSVTVGDVTIEVPHA